MTPPGPIVHVRRSHKIQVIQEGPDVTLVMDGRLVFSANWDYAMQVGKSLIDRSLAARQHEALSKKT